MNIWIQLLILLSGMLLGAQIINVIWLRTFRKYVGIS